MPPRCGIPGGGHPATFLSKKQRWRGLPRAFPSHPPGGNHEYRTAETRTQADLGIKARAPDAPTLHALTPWHSPHQIPPTESLTCGSRGLPASHFEFSQHRHAHPATVGDECTSPAKHIPSVLFCFRAFSFTCQVADFGAGGATTETSQAGSEDLISALGVFSGGSSTPIWTSSKPRSTSQR